MLLIDYLNGLDLSDDELVSHFATEFGVKVKIENDLFLFKYDQLGAKWDKPLVRECRGVILRKMTDGSFKVVSRPFDKFFNLHEGHCSVNDETDLTGYSLVQKADGTNIRWFWDEVRNEWRCSTLGTISAQACGDSSWTFEELFKRTITDFDLFVSELNKEYTHLFELCTVENRIVTKYPEDTIFYLISRHNQSGDYKSF